MTEIIILGSILRGIDLVTWSQLAPLLGEIWERTFWRAEDIWNPGANSLVLNCVELCRYGWKWQ